MSQTNDNLARFDSLERQGLDALESGDFDAAAKFLVEAVAGYERLGDPLRTNAAGYYLGIALAGQGKMSRALRIWQEIIDRGWDSPAAFNRLIRYYESQNDADKVQRLFDRLHHAAEEQTGKFFAAYPAGQTPGTPTGLSRTERMPDDRRRVLIADDEPAVCALIERVLGPRGYSVLEVSNGYDALRITLTTRLDLIVLDVFMPGYSGLDILYRVRAEGIETPVIVISGRPDDQMVDDAKTLGAIWMAKPFDGEAMVKMVEATIGEACETPSDTATSS